jgi:hypothetical protein
MLDRRAPFIAHKLLHVPVATAASDAARLLAASDERDIEALAATMPLPMYDCEWWARLVHEAAHAVCAWENGSRDINAVIRDDGTGAVSYSPIDSLLDATTCHLVGVAAEARAYPPSLRRYAHGCFDFTAARLLIDKFNADGLWPPQSCEAAAKAAVAFVDLRWKQIGALALALGSAGSLTDYEVRLFAVAGAQ